MANSKNDIMLKDPEASSIGLGDEPNYPEGLGDVRKVC